MLYLFGWILLCELAGIIGVFFTTPAIPTWYATLVKPSFSPPNWLFGPVWTILYALMGISVYRIWRIGTKRKEVRDALTWFFINLTLNAVWSPIFFGAQQIAAAFVVISAIWVSIIILIFRYHKLDSVSSYLLVPYLLWVSFATVLNYNLWLLNPVY